MTKQTKPAKLQLSLHTVRSLNQLELVVVRGGGTRLSSPDPDDGDPDDGCEIRRA